MATIKGKDSNTPEDTGTQQALGRKATQFKPGQRGNPKGRPKGCTQPFGKFLEVLEADFNKHGAQAIEQVREKKPEVYMRVVLKSKNNPLIFVRDVLGAAPEPWPMTAYRSGLATALARRRALPQ